MASHDYLFRTHWRVRASPEEVADVLKDAASLPKWWPAVYLSADEIEPGDENGVGKVVELHTRGWLPYTLRWSLRVTESFYPKGFAIAATGDFDGTGRWTIEPDGAWTDVFYDWKIRAEKPLLRRLSWLLKPVFAANHRWAMSRGLESLRLELKRRRAGTAAARARVAAPPRPARSGAVFVAVAAASVLAGLVYRRARR
jgi:Polyketide cyclase / dehydrase and lipid transport